MTPRAWTAVLRRIGAIRASSGEHILRHVVKSLVAVVLTWQLIALWLPGQQQFLGVAVALAMVNESTVYSSVVNAVRRVVIQVSGVFLAVAAAWMLGATAGAVVAVLAVVLLTATLPCSTGGRRNGEDRLQIASTALITLTAAAATPVGHVVAPAVVTLTGAVVGVAANALILPPTYLSRSDAAVRGLARCMGTLLQDMGRGLREGRSQSHAHIWLERGRDLEQQVAEARDEVQKAAESLRWNARAAARGQQVFPAYEYGLGVLHTASFEVRGIARTLADTVGRDADDPLKQGFALRYGEVLDLAGQVFITYVAVGTATDSAHADAQRQLRTVIDRMLAWHTSVTDLMERGTQGKLDAWHVYGSLIADIERLLADLGASTDSAARFGSVEGGVHPEVRADAVRGVGRGEEGRETMPRCRVGATPRVAP
ncbi:hypothetical protein [Streptomyces sp. NPDC046805]|uniref:hypothetical protein n=1 Tax=Streptomyces sp. NPDC046805 TaxID=3155134 RepID=UPI0033CC3E6B